MDIMVSVICLAYNHEKYIRQCLDGFVMQKTNFPFEVLINDDASTDNTARIIREYEEKYPEIIKPTYQTENQYSRGVKIAVDILFPQAKGKYIAFCEGDDYWIDEYKLQKQFDIMEQNPDCHMCVHAVQKIYETGEYRKDKFPGFYIKTGIINTQFMIEGYNVQTSSYFCTRKDLLSLYCMPPKFATILPHGDFATRLYFAYLGSIYYIEDIMSCYRTNSSSSVSNHLSSIENENVVLADIQALKEFDVFSKRKYHSCIERCIKSLEFKIELDKKNIKKIFSGDNRELLLSKAGMRSFCISFFPRIMHKYYKIQKVFICHVRKK